MWVCRFLTKCECQCLWGGQNTAQYCAQDDGPSEVGRVLTWTGTGIVRYRSLLLGMLTWFWGLKSGSHGPSIVYLPVSYRVGNENYNFR